MSRALTARLRRERTVVVQVSAPSAHADVLVAAVQARLHAIAGLQHTGQSGPEVESPSWVGEAVPVPGGVIILLDLGGLPAAVRVRAGGLLAAALDRAGVADATVGLPPTVPDSWWELDQVGPSARAHLRPPLGLPYDDAGDNDQAGALLAGLPPKLHALAGELPLYLLGRSSRLCSTSAGTRSSKRVAPCWPRRGSRRWSPPTGSAPSSR